MLQSGVQGLRVNTDMVEGVHVNPDREHDSVDTDRWVICSEDVATKQRDVETYNAISGYDRQDQNACAKPTNDDSNKVVTEDTTKIMDNASKMHNTGVLLDRKNNCDGNLPKGTNSPNVSSEIRAMEITVVRDIREIGQLLLQSPQSLSDPAEISTSINAQMDKCHEDCNQLISLSCKHPQKSQSTSKCVFPNHKHNANSKDSKIMKSSTSGIVSTSMINVDCNTILKEKMADVPKQAKPKKLMMKRTPPKSKWKNIMSTIEANKYEVKRKSKRQFKSILSCYTPTSSKTPVSSNSSINVDEDNKISTNGSQEVLNMHIKPENSQVVGGKCNRAISKGKRIINYPKIDLSKVKSKVDMHVGMPKKQRPTDERHSFSKGGKCSSKTGSRTNSSTSLASLPEDMSLNRRHSASKKLHDRDDMPASNEGDVHGEHQFYFFLMKYGIFRYLS